MSTMDILLAGSTSNLEPPGKILSDDESTINNNLHNQELDNDVESSDSDDFLTLKALKNRVTETRATSATMEVASTSDKENREQENKLENNFNVNDNNSNSSANNILNNFKSVGSRLRKIIDSDSDDDDVTFNKTSDKKLSSANSSPELSEKMKNFKSKRRMRFNSDSESENEEQSKDTIKDDKKDSEDDKDFPVAEKSEVPAVETSNNKIKKFSTLIDSESEDENYINNRSPSESEVKESEEDEENTSSIKKSKKDKLVKKKSGSKRAAKDEAMKQIHSETQRLLREASLSLPYHKPKQRSLEEFLNRKKKIVFDLPSAPTTVAKVKMSAAIVSQVLEEKEKEAELFFESSDSEEEKDENKVQSDNDIPSKPAADNNLQVDQNSDIKIQSEDTVIKLTCVEESQENIFQKDEDRLWTQKDAKAAVSRRLFHGLSIDVDNQGSENLHSECMEVDQQSDEQIVIKKDESKVDESSAIINDEERNGKKLIYCQKIGNYSQASEIGNSKNDKKFIDKIEENVNKDNSLDPAKETSVPLPTTSNLLDEDDELLNKKMMTGEDIEKLIEEEEKMNKEFSSKKDGSVISSDEDDEKINDNKDSSTMPEGHVFGLPPLVLSPEKMFETPKIPASTISSNGNVKKHVLSTLCHAKPKLKGAPGMVIDLTSAGKPDKEAINSLVDRFLTKHSAVTKNTDDKKELTVLQTEVTPDGLKVVKDTLPYKIPVNDNEDPELSKPGAKLARLKEDLKKRMFSRRNEEWKQKEKESQNDEEEEKEEEEEAEYGENNSKLMDEDDDEGESEPEEDDVPMKESKRKQCDFGDEEAEVSEDENTELSEDENEEDAEEDEEEDEAENDAEDEEEDDEEDQEQDPTKQKKFCRIVAMDEDSNSCDENDAKEEKSDSIKKRFDRLKTDVDIFDDDEDFPSYQIPQDDIDTNSPVYATPNHSQSQYTKLNQLSFPISGSPQAESPPKSIPSLMNSWNIDHTQTQDNNASQRKLFQSENKPVSDEELLALCSGGFTDIESSQASSLPPRLNGLVDTNNAKPISESQLLSLCSGKFDTQPSQEHCSIDNNDETSQDFHLTFDENSQSHSNEKPGDKMEKNVITEVKETALRSLTIASSSEDEAIKESNNEEKSTKKVLKKKKEKKKVKQLVLSDDEEDRDQVNSDDEEEEDEEAGLESDDEEKFIDYDSEENEVVVVPKKDIKKVAANFLEAEAELSESEWGSEDEDEKELDNLELEEGDAEEIDEDQMRDQLGKLHARQVLDDDQRDVRMLKEMLFDDGDLHADGAGRERRFRWKNIDKLTDDTLAGPIDDDEDENGADPNDIASEIEWRKLRLEREKFLEEKIKSADEDLLNNEIASGGQLFKLGMKVLKKQKNCIEESNVNVVSSKPIIPRTVSELMGTPVGEKSKLLHNAMKRGSFLARGDEALARLAVVIKQTDNVVLGPKHSRNFLFTHLSPSVDDADEDEERAGDKNGMKSDNKTRKRKSITGGTPKTAKKAKTEENRSAKKLF